MRDAYAPNGDFKIRQMGEANTQSCDVTKVSSEYGYISVSFSRVNQTKDRKIEFIRLIHKSFVKLFWYVRLEPLEKCE